METSNEDAPPIVFDVVLVGCGHAHVHVLKMFGMPAGRRLRRRLGLRLTLISSHGRTPYSGMLPGYIAGHYSYDDIHLDCRRLARFANARFIHAAVNGIAYAAGGGMIDVTDGRPPLRYDCLSIDIGSAPLGAMNGEDMMIPVKPIANLSGYWDAVLEDYRRHLGRNEEETEEQMYNNKEDVPYTVAIVGGGAGGIELALSIQHRLLEIQNEPPDCPAAELQVIVVTRGSTLMEAYGNRSVRRKFVRLLNERHISVRYNAEVERVVGYTAPPGDGSHNGPSTRRQKQLLLFTTAGANQEQQPLLVDACVGCTSAGAASWLSTATPFGVTDAGHFLRVHDTYELLHHPGVFAAGDCCHMDRYPRPKAGVYAVRAGPILYQNILRYLQGRPLLRHRPQSTYLSLISTGDQYAVASKGRWFCLEGKWLWHVKDWIDRKWMAKYSTELPDLEEMMAKMRRRRPMFGRRRDGPNGDATFLKHRKDNDDILEAFSKNAMRCGGCGAKVGATIVSRVLKAVYQRQVLRAAQELGYAVPAPIDHDDAAITLLPSTPGAANGAAIVQTIDYFREMISDPFLFGQLVAVHALSDMHAMGTTAQTAMVLAVAPFAADDAITENTLTHLLSGVSDVLQDENIRLVGGHTCEGLELACGLSVQGYTPDPETLWRKRGGRVGDQIVLTKPLGTGALFAAEMRGRASSEHVQEALEIMLQSNYPVSCAARDFCRRHGHTVVRGCTDVTGFGLIGHLLEMLLANDAESSNSTEVAVESIGAVLDVRSIPFYTGGLEAAKMGIFSSLQKQNARNRRTVVNHAESAAAFPTRYPLLYDPQTAGGLLFFVDPSHCDEFVSHLNVSGHAKFARVIGEIQAYNADIMMETTAHHSNREVFSSACVIGHDHLSTEHRILIDYVNMASDKE
jgi:selenide, water dikinase